MKQRDKEIIGAIEKFRVLDRDQLVRMFFRQHRSPISGCNTVMNRLKLQGRVDVDTKARPYRYYPSGSKMKRDSAKLPHHAAIADFYLDVCSYIEPDVFEIERKVADGVIPDAFMIWRGTPFFVEVQVRGNWTAKQVRRKIEDYEEYYVGGSWKALEWQRKDKPVFPYVLLVAPKPYELGDVSRGVRVLQVADFHEFMTKYVR